MTLPRTISATAAGTKVSERIRAEVSARTTVKAIGWNIFPSIPVRAKIGKYTTVMMITPNIDGLITSLDASAARENRSSRVSKRPRLPCFSANRRRQFSTMITAPSTIRPKSSAPRLIRLPDTLFSTIPVIVISIATGMTAAVMSAARIFPSRRNRTRITSDAPSARFFSTVAIVASTRVVRL